MTTRDPDKTPPKKRGPDPETLKLEGDWEERVKEALQKPPEPKDANEQAGDDGPG